MFFLVLFLRFFSE